MKHLSRRLGAALCALALCMTSARALSVEQALTLLEENYVDPLPAAAYEAASLIELFVTVGDPYTYYMSAADYEAFTAGVEDETSITGIGAGIEYTANGIRITSLLEGGGAKDAGLKVDDYIIAANGVSCVPAGDAHRGLIVGEAGTYVTITVRHADGTTRDYRIERRALTVHNTTVTANGGVGVIDCDSFGSQTEAYFAEGIAQHEKTVDHWLIDLRGNLGGLADAAVGALGAFTGGGPKLYYRLADSSSFYTLYLADKLTEKPAIVLVDENSASASEILSGGVRAEDAGIVIGARTYGKGTAQIVLDEEEYPDLFDGDSLKVTAYRFYCADGNTTDKIGVIPTLLVADEYAEDVAALLTAEKPKSGEFLCFMLNGCLFYVDLASARGSDALSALFAALPPDILVNYASGGEVVSCLDAADTAKRLGVAYDDRRFTDLADSPYPTPIDTLAVYGMLRGDGTGRFYPKQKLTRAELAVMLAQALNLTDAVSMGFSDVPRGVWFASGVNAVAGLGFLNGVGGGRFDPNGALTQAELLAVMGRLARFLNFRADDYALALGEDEPADAALAALPDWARTEARVLTDYNGTMLYTELPDIDPTAPVTRGEAAATLCNILKTLDILSY